MAMTVSSAIEDLTFDTHLIDALCFGRQCHQTMPVWPDALPVCLNGRSVTSRCHESDNVVDCRQKIGTVATRVGH